MKTFLATTMPLSVILSVCFYHPAEATTRNHAGSSPQQPIPLTLVRGEEHVGGGEFHGSHEGFSGSHIQKNQGQNRLENREVRRNDDDFMRNNAVVSGEGFDVGADVGMGIGGGVAVDDGGEGITNTSNCSYDDEGNLVCNVN